MGTERCAHRARLAAHVHGGKCHWGPSKGTRSLRFAADGPPFFAVGRGRSRGGPCLALVQRGGAKKRGPKMGMCAVARLSPIPCPSHDFQWPRVMPT